MLGASASWETPAPVNSHQVALRLADRGHRVLYVESTGLRSPSPFRTSHDLSRMVRRVRGFLGGVRQVAPNLQVLSPVALPGVGSRGLRELSMRGLGRAVAGAARRLGLERPVLWAFLPTYLRTADALDPSLVVYHCVDHYAGKSRSRRGLGGGGGAPHAAAGRPRLRDEPGSRRTAARGATGRRAGRQRGGRRALRARRDRGAPRAPRAAGPSPAACRLRGKPRRLPDRLRPASGRGPLAPGAAAPPDRRGGTWGTWARGHAPARSCWRCPMSRRSVRDRSAISPPICDTVRWH